jgi:hypothetical protein
VQTTANYKADLVSIPIDITTIIFSPSDVVNMQAIFLGAGASKALGLPATGELLPKIVESANSNELFAGDPEARLQTE